MDIRFARRFWSIIELGCRTTPFSNIFVWKSNQAMKEIFLLFLSLIAFSFGYSECQVINSNTKEPIAFAQIKVIQQSAGILANISGEFEMNPTWRKPIL